MNHIDLEMLSKGLLNWETLLGLAELRNEGLELSYTHYPVERKGRKSEITRANDQHRFVTKGV